MKPTAFATQIKAMYGMMYPIKDIAVHMGCSVKQVQDVLDEHSANIASLMEKDGRDRWARQVTQALSMIQLFYPLAMKGSKDASRELREWNVRLESLMQTFTLASNNPDFKLSPADLARVAREATLDEKQAILEGRKEAVYGVLKKLMQKQGDE